MGLRASAELAIQGIFFGEGNVFARVSGGHLNEGELCLARRHRITLCPGP